MKQVLHIGEKVTVPPEYITKVISVLAMRGAGKTYAAGVISEELIDYLNSKENNNANLVIIDPVGAHWGLRSHYPIHIIGGDHGDIDIDLDSGKLFAEMVNKFNLNVILDVSQYQQDEMVQFIADFLVRYYQVTKTPTHIIIEEADVFAPQRMTSKAQRSSLAAVDTVVRRGRGRGIGVTMITQRPAVLNKNVLTQSDGALIMNMTGETDLKVIGEYLNSAGARKNEIADYIEKIMKFNKGQGLLFSPSWLKEIKIISIRKKVSFHAGAEPKLGEPNPADKVKLIHMNKDVLIRFLNGDKTEIPYMPNQLTRHNEWTIDDIHQVQETEQLGMPEQFSTVKSAVKSIAIILFVAGFTFGLVAIFA